MYEFRFLKGVWKFGKFKLQYRTWIVPGELKPGHMPIFHGWGDWIDVPTVEQEALCPQP